MLLKYNLSIIKVKLNIKKIIINELLNVIVFIIILIK